MAPRKKIIGWSVTEKETAATTHPGCASIAANSDVWTVGANPDRRRIICKPIPEAEIAPAFRQQHKTAVADFSVRDALMRR